LLSAAALGYPSPVFVNWGDEENPDPYVQHVAKVGGIHRYLSKLSPEHDNDIALIVDGYDVWFQLHPDVMIQRYFEVINQANKRLANRLGVETMSQRGIYQSVLFGPDKICWPEDPRRAACWAVPDSTLPPYVFGPDTDTGKWRDHNRPRWLNSGTIMGPIGDVRKLLNATKEEIQLNGTVVSDQWHMQNIWGRQEYARTLLADGPIESTRRRAWISDGYAGEGHYEDVDIEIPELNPSDDHEFHITIDYESKLFQTVSYYWRYVGWSRTSSDNDSQGSSTASGTSSSLMSLPEDVQNSPPPLHDASSLEKDQGLQPLSAASVERSEATSGMAWRDVKLGMNTATGNVFGLIHFTPPKEYRDWWWSRMWYFAYGEAVIHGPQRSTGGKLITSTEDGRDWFGYEAESMEEVVTQHRVGGGFGDRGGWYSWRRLCAAHEDAVFRG